MELKKNPEANLSRMSGLFFSIGLTISLLITITAFEWKFSDDGNLVDLGQVNENFEDLLEIPPTSQPPPPPPQIQQPEIIEVKNDEVIEEEIDVNLDVEITEQQVVQRQVVIQEAAPEEEVADEIFTVVENQPEPPGGMSAFYEYVGKNMKYPAQARRMGIEGRVFVQFVVNTDGSLTDVQAIRGIGAGCDEEAVKVIQGAPKWKPGKQRGRAVRVRMVMPIIFKLG